tara:strand:- start:371 stop:712 length:342 start_codon:yes stop_codon:yes gene_type:complete
MQSIASILEKEANFVEIFNEATHGNHQFGGYPNEQYYLYMKYGDEFMAKKWGNERLCSDTGIVENVDVWASMQVIAMTMTATAQRGIPCPSRNVWCKKGQECTDCKLSNYYGE